MSVQAKPRLLPYASRLDSRDIATIELLVVHCTELPDLEMAREYGEHIHYPDSGTGNSGHYYIDRNGETEVWVPENRIAHHVRGFNERSIGIELVNTGRYPDWLHSGNQNMSEPYPEQQMQALYDLVNALVNHLPGLMFIAGHEDLDSDMVAASDNPEVSVRRKRDPGPLFPWDTIITTTGLKRVFPENLETSGAIP